MQNYLEYRGEWTLKARRLTVCSSPPDQFPLIFVEENTARSLRNHVFREIAVLLSFTYDGGEQCGCI